MRHRRVDTPPPCKTIQIGAGTAPDRAEPGTPRTRPPVVSDDEESPRQSLQVASSAADDFPLAAFATRRWCCRCCCRWKWPRQLWRWLEDLLGDVADRIARIAGFILVPLLVALLAWETTLFFCEVLPRMRGHGLPFSMCCCITVQGLFLLTNLLYNYGMAVMTEPGLPPLACEEESDAVVVCATGVGAGAVAAAAEGDVTAAFRTCKICQRQRPPRTHHCSACRRCVLRMDHHCPWVNNCVGLRNYKFFCLFLLYLAACCLWVTLVFPYASKTHSLLDDLDLLLSTMGVGCVLAAFILIIIFVFASFHAHLVFTNQTTIEWWGNMPSRCRAWREWQPWRSRYDLGWSRNFQQVFGDCSWYTFRWLLPQLPHAM